MKILCGAELLDVDALNGFDPDGNGPFCQVYTAGYGEKIDGYAVTEDGGTLAYTDIAFKMLADMCAKDVPDCAAYLLSELERGNRSGRELMMPAGPLKEFLKKELDVSCVLLPKSDLVIGRNLDALSAFGEDLASQLRPAVGNYLGKYIYFGRRARSFPGIHGVLSELLEKLEGGDLKTFTERYYLILGNGTKKSVSVPSVFIPGESDGTAHGKLSYITFDTDDVPGSLAAAVTEHAEAVNGDWPPLPQADGSFTGAAAEKEVPDVEAPEFPKENEIPFEESVPEIDDVVPEIKGENEVKLTESAGDEAVVDDGGYEAVPEIKDEDEVKLTESAGDEAVADDGEYEDVPEIKDEDEVKLTESAGDEAVADDGEYEAVPEIKDEDEIKLTESVGDEAVADDGEYEDVPEIKDEDEVKLTESAGDEAIADDGEYEDVPEIKDEEDAGSGEDEESVPEIDDGDEITLSESVGDEAVRDDGEYPEETVSPEQDVSSLKAEAMAEKPSEPEYPEPERHMRPARIGDIMGIDETYTTGYYEEAYDKSLEQADSDGWLDRTITARAEGGATPVEIMSERVHDEEEEAHAMRSKYSMVRDAVRGAMDSSRSGNRNEPAELMRKMQDLRDHAKEVEAENAKRENR